MIQSDLPVHYLALMHDVQTEADLIMTLAGAMAAAVILGLATKKLKLSPIVGYLLAGVVVGPFTPGFVANHELASQTAEIGVVLLMFGVGLHFHVKDLMAVRRIAIPGSLAQIAVATALGALATHALGWSWGAGVVFGLAIAVTSTVVLTRMLIDNKILNTPDGHLAAGWLIAEDLFTVLALVLLPAFAGGTSQSGGRVWPALVLALVKVIVLVAFTLIFGGKIIPKLFNAVAKTGSRELFTLTVLVVALGIAVVSARFFGASMPLGAFLAGMIVGQSSFGERAASDALPLRDAFAVLFFVSVGMLLDPSAILRQWPFMLLTLGIIFIGKPVAAFLVMRAFKRPLQSALIISIALTQIGEFSFILAALAAEFKILPAEAMNTLVFAAIVSISLNPLLFKLVDPLASRLQAYSLLQDRKPGAELPSVV